MELAVPHLGILDYDRAVIHDPFGNALVVTSDSD